MANDTLKDKLSRPVKAAADYAKNLYTQGKALVAPIDKGTAQTLQDNAAQIGKVKAEQPKPAQASPSSYKKGGKVKKGGAAKVHKGERVLTVKQSKAFEKKGGFGKLYGK